MARTKRYPERTMIRLPAGTLERLRAMAAEAGEPQYVVWMRGQVLAALSRAERQAGVNVPVLQDRRIRRTSNPIRAELAKRIERAL